VVEGAVAMVAVRVVLAAVADTDLHVAMRRRLSFAPRCAELCGLAMAVGSRRRRS